MFPRKGSSCDRYNQVISIFDPLFVKIMEEMNNKLKEKYSGLTYTEALSFFQGYRYFFEAPSSITRWVRSTL